MGIKEERRGEDTERMDAAGEAAGDDDRERIDAEGEGGGKEGRDRVADFVASLRVRPDWYRTSTCSSGASVEGASVTSSKR